MREDYLPHRKDGKKLLFNIEVFDTNGNSEKIVDNFKRLVMSSTTYVVPKSK